MYRKYLFAFSAGQIRNAERLKVLGLSVFIRCVHKYYEHSQKNKHERSMTYREIFKCTFYENVSCIGFPGNVAYINMHKTFKGLSFYIPSTQWL